MININLKEVFSVDNPADLASKLNFNFNQLLALGFGEPGATGATGNTGAAGPQGPIGPQGEAGPQVYSDTALTTGVTITSSAVSSAVIGDYFITDDKIYKKTASGTSGWDVITDFYDIFNSISLAGSSTWQLGINASSIAKILVPIKNSKGIDRITTAGTGGSYTTNAPNWIISGGTAQNSQTVLFNFDPNTTKNIVSGSSSLNGYSVTPSTDRLGSLGSLDINEEAFPYTALLSLYSFFEAASATTEADHLTGSTGYRHQLELGSVDDLVENQLTSSSDAKYVISPTYQNLRVRKFRISDTTIPGQAVIRVDFNLHSADSVTTPALNSRFTWTINKKTAAGATTSSPPNNRIIQLGLSNSILEGSSTTDSRITGALVDGLHLNFDSLYKLGIGFDPDNIANSTKNAIMRSDSANSIDNMVFDEIKVTVKNNSSTAILTENALTSNTAFTLTSTGTGTNGDMQVKAGGASGGNLMLLAPNTAKEIILGAGTSNTSSYAIKIKGNRLSTAIPFPVSTSTVPTANSLDVNVLDEYQEGTFTPVISFGGNSTLPYPGTSANSNLTNAQPTIGDEVGYYTKVGKVVTFQLSFSITDWTLQTSASSPSGTHSPVDLSVADIGNIGPITNDPFEYGIERYALLVRGIPNHWPWAVDQMKFNVNVWPSVSQRTSMRSFPLQYQWGGNGAGTSSTYTALAVDPASVHAVFSYYNSSVSNKAPQLVLKGNRQLYTGSSGVVSSTLCYVNAWDFLKYDQGNSSDNKSYVVIHGTYLTNHQTANSANPIGVTSQDSGGAGGVVAAASGG